MTKENEREYDPELGGAPLTRVEAFFLFSKMKRLMAAHTSLLLALQKKDLAALKAAKLDRELLNKEINSLLDALVYPVGGEK